MEKDALKIELNKCLSEEQIKAFGEIVIKAAKFVYDSIVEFVKEKLFPLIMKYKNQIIKTVNMEQYRKKQQRRMQLYKKRRAKYGKR